jgi:hypothetical protein
MKQLITTAVLLFSITAFAQVGINNTSPKATLDITAKTNGTKPEGLIIPQLSGSDIRIATAASVYGTAQKGLIVYASAADSAPAGATASITAPGYYYFDGSVWQKIATGNTLNTSLASGNILVGSASNVATAVTPTGDVAISNAGITSIGAGKVTTTHLANNAVTVAKLPTGATATTFLRGDGTWVTPTDTNTTYIGSTSIGLNGTSFERAALTGDVTASANNNATTIAANAVTTSKIANNAVTVAKLPTGATATTFLRGDGTWVTPTDTNTTYTGSTSIGLNGTSFERAALTGDVTASANSNATTIAANAVNSAKIADGTVANADLDAGVGGIYKGNGSLSGNTTVTQGDKTLAFTSSPTLGTSHFTIDGTTLNVDAVNNRVGIGTSSPSTKLDINSSTSGAVKIVDGTQGTSKVLTSDANGVATWSFSGVRTVRVAATGARNTSGTYSLTPGEVIVYTIENLDVDNAYNSTTGVFTAPRDGYYTFEVATYISSSNTTATNAYVDLMWSANTLGSYELGRVWESSSTASGAWYLKQGTNTMFLTAGQTIKVVFFQGGTSPRIDNSVSSWPNTFGLNRLVITY